MSEVGVENRRSQQVVGGSALDRLHLWHAERIPHAMLKHRRSQQRHQHEHACAARVMMNVQSILPGSVVNVAGTQATLLSIMVVNVMGVGYFALIVGVDDDA